MHDCENRTCWLQIGHYGNEMSCAVRFCGDWLMAQELKGDGQASTALVTWLCCCSAPAEGH